MGVGEAKQGLSWRFVFELRERAEEFELEDEVDYDGVWCGQTILPKAGSLAWVVDAAWERWTGAPWLGGNSWDKRAWSKFAQKLARADRELEKALNLPMPRGLILAHEREQLGAAAGPAPSKGASGRL